MADHPSIVEVFSNSTNSWSVGLVVDSKDNKLVVRFLDPEGVARQKVASRTDSQFARFGEHIKRALPPTFLEVPSNSRPGHYSFFDPIAKRKVGSIELAWKVFLEPRLLDDQLEAAGGLPTSYGSSPGSQNGFAEHSAGPGTTYGYPGYIQQSADVPAAQAGDCLPTTYGSNTGPSAFGNGYGFAGNRDDSSYPGCSAWRPSIHADFSADASLDQADGYFATRLAQMGNGYDQHAQGSAASGYPHYADWSSNMPTAQAAEPPPGILGSSLRPKSGHFGFATHANPRSMAPSSRDDQAWDRRDDVIGPQLWDPWHPGAELTKQMTPTEEPMTTEIVSQVHVAIVPKPRKPVTVFRKDEKSKILEPILVEPVVTELVSKPSQPVEFVSHRQSEYAESQDVQPLSQSQLASDREDSYTGYQEVHPFAQRGLASQRQSSLSQLSSERQTPRGATLEVHPSAVREFASQRQTSDTPKQELQPSSPSKAPSASHHDAVQRRGAASPGPTRSSAEDWVANYVHMPVEKTPGLMYFNRIPVNYTKFVELMMPVAYVNEAHRERIIKEVESGAVMNTSLELFTRSHVDMEGNLHWQDCGITNFVTWVFHAHNIGAPTEDLIQPLFEVLDVEKNGYLSVWEGLCLVDALMRATFMKEFIMPEPPPDEGDT